MRQKSLLYSLLVQKNLLEADTFATGSALFLALDNKPQDQPAADEPQPNNKA